MATTLATSDMKTASKYNGWGQSWYKTFSFCPAPHFFIVMGGAGRKNTVENPKVLKLGFEFEFLFLLFTSSNC